MNVSTESLMKFYTQSMCHHCMGVDNLLNGATVLADLPSLESHFQRHSAVDYGS